MVAPPGAGKGTQAVRLAAHYDITHLSSGELLRHEVATGTELGRRVSEYVARGDLVPDDIVLEMVMQPALEAAARGGYVLDGFPRNVHQAEEAYRRAIQIGGVELEAVVHLAVSRGELRRRMLARAHVEGRTDDSAETIEHRLDVFDGETRPLLDYYRGRGLVLDVDGEQPVDDVFTAIVAAIDAIRGTRAGARPAEA
jgi:adenylate kinase